MSVREQKEISPYQLRERKKPGSNMSQLKSITLRLPEEEYRAIDAICNEKGYSETGKFREFIRRLIKNK